MTTAGTAPLLDVQQVARHFGGLAAVRSVDLELMPGELLGLIGPNGSGKTTLLSLIAGQRPPSAGRIRFHGRDVTGQGAVRLCRAGIACTFQLVRLPETMNARDNVAVAAMYGRRRLSVSDAREEAEALLDEVGFTGDPDAGTGALTYFDQKRIELARALATDPLLLLLDEWLAGLTPTELNDGIALIRSLHRQRGLAIIMVEHVMAAIRELCGRVVVLNAGEVIAVGPTEDCLAHPDVVRVYLGDEDA